MPAALGLRIDQFWSIDIFGIVFFFLDEDRFIIVRLWAMAREWHEDRAIF